MNHHNWSESDYQRAKEYISRQEEGTQTSPLWDCGNNLFIIIPKGLPALGIRFHGLFMLTPLPLIMSALVFFPIYGFLNDWKLSFTTLAITLGCALFFFGLTRVIILMAKNRELFPRQYFITVSPNGVAMHFNGFHFPFRESRTSLLWKNVINILQNNEFFLPGLLLGKLVIKTVKIIGEENKSIIIPFYLNGNQQQAELEKIKSFLDNYLENQE